MASKSRSRLTSAVRTAASRRTGPASRWRASGGANGRSAQRVSRTTAPGGAARAMAVTAAEAQAPDPASEALTLAGVPSAGVDPVSDTPAGSETLVMQAPRTSDVVADRPATPAPGPRPGAPRHRPRHRPAARSSGSAATPRTLVSSPPTRATRSAAAVDVCQARRSAVVLSPSGRRALVSRMTPTMGSDGQAQHGQPEPDPDEAAAVPESDARAACGDQSGCTHRASRGWSGHSRPPGDRSGMTRNAHRGTGPLAGAPCPQAIPLSPVAPPP